ncbi:hypothetical protein OB2597_06435 [Pseudooceanicola batsensis HTCC2597]|uniref:Copper-binding protein n=1 Tax=Pseudooceanicola batsensis (strain ATCC BAA-863 / DSM 15984 / KCTC 12145 / HTCC2597) TaxID=252305 RepID=A3TTC2_PSEBH|nr:copper chaperone PCu(A)C [Pseudooceanicola batsensis]EAQ04899.1 hypothetical protein OB2597_06435 [Pseudooceanicola batsensis HTCC2597]
MFTRTLALAGLSTLALASAAMAEITVNDPYARSSGPMAMAGAAFMELVNSGDEDDRLIAVRSDAAKRVELHTHLSDDSGVMKMREVEDGFPVPAGGHHRLKRGGDHVMFMGLNHPFEQGATIPVTLVFEKAGEIAVDIPVDLERQDDAHHGHGDMKMGD